MREELHRFFRAARGAGVRVSPAESIDAMKAVADVGFAERGILRDTLLLTLAKSQEEKQALGDCFDLFFSQPEVQGRDRAGGFRRQPRCGRDGKRERAGRSGRAGAGTRRSRADADVARPQRDRGRDGGGVECRLIVRHPLLYPARHFLVADSRTARHRAAARRSGRADGDKSRRRRTAGGRAGGLARKRARGRQPGAGALRPRGNREPAQRDPAQRAAGPARTPARSSR